MTSPDGAPALDSAGAPDQFAAAHTAAEYESGSGAAAVGIVEPEVSGPETVESESSETEVAELATSEPEAAESRTAEFGAAETAASGTEKSGSAGSVLGSVPVPGSTSAPPSVHAAHSTPHLAAAPPQLIESTQIRRALNIAGRRTRLNWSVFVGSLGADTRAEAEARHGAIGPLAARSVLIAVDPATHRLEIVTGTEARTVLDDRSCALAAASMAGTFAVRDLDGGIARGILALVEHVRKQRR